MSTGGAMPGAEPPSLSGMMYKVGRRMKRKVGRFYLLSQGSLEYTKSEKDTSGAKRIALQQAYVHAPQSTNQGLLPVVIDTNGKRHELLCSTEEERDRWHSAIRAAVLKHSIFNGYIDKSNKQNLGSGNFGDVKLFSDKTSGQEVAVKIVKKARLSEAEKKMMKKEVEIMTKMQHPNVVNLVEFIEDDNHYYLVQEYMAGGELFDRIINAPEGKYTEKEASRVMAQIMSALCYMHERDAAHRDLKPENFLMVDDTPQANVKVADFGFAEWCPAGKQLQEVCGSPGYVAPEVIAERGYGVQADIWSMGVILYILLTGLMPFSGDNEEEIFRATLSGRFSKEPLSHLSDSARDLVFKMLVKDPSHRISARQVLQHPWVAGSEAATVPLTATQANLKSLMARMKWKKAILATVATQRMAQLTRIARSASKSVM